MDTWIVSKCLLFIFLLLVRQDKVEESKLVDVLRGSDNTKPVSERVLLQESLGEVLDVLAGELGVRDNLDLVAISGHLNSVTEVASSVVDLDVFNKELLEGGHVDDFIVGVGRSVNDELLSLLLLLLLGLL